MTQSSVEVEKRFRWAAIGGPLGLWSTISGSSAEFSWVLAGKLSLMSANAAVMLFLANHLELKTYGLLVVTISAQLMISRLLILGVDSGMVRLTALPELRSRSQEVVTAGLISIVRMSGVLLVIVLLATPVLSQFSIAGWVPLIIAMGAIGTALVDYGYSFRLARHEYPLAAVAQGGTSIWRLSLTIISALLTRSPIAVFVAYHGASLLSGILQTILITKQGKRTNPALRKRLLGYSKWQAQANVVVIFTLYQGTFILTLLNQPAETGLFGLSLTLSLGFFAVYNAYSEYLCVRIRPIENIRQIPTFLRRSMAAGLALVLACIPVVIGVAWLVVRLLPPEWHDVVPIFVYLSAGMVVLILQAPLVATCHYMLRPHFITSSWLMCAVSIGLLGFILAPKMGATGAAIAQLVGSVVATLAFSWMVIVSLRAAIEIDAEA